MAQWLMENFLIPYPYLCLGVFGLSLITACVCAYRELKQAIPYFFSKRRFHTELKEKLSQAPKRR